MIFGEQTMKDVFKWNELKSNFIHVKKTFILNVPLYVH